MIKIYAVLLLAFVITSGAIAAVNYSLLEYSVVKIAQVFQK
jgi:hypothetical protein